MTVLGRDVVSDVVVDVVVGVEAGDDGGTGELGSWRGMNWTS